MRYRPAHAARRCQRVALARRRGRGGGAWRWGAVALLVAAALPGLELRSGAAAESSSVATRSTSATATVDTTTVDTSAPPPATAPAAAPSATPSAAVQPSPSPAAPSATPSLAPSAAPSTTPTAPVDVEPAPAPAGATLGVLAGRLVAGSSAGPFLLTWTAGPDGFAGDVRVALAEPWGAPASAAVQGGSCQVDRSPAQHGRTVTTGVVCPPAGVLALRLGPAAAPRAVGGYPLVAAVRTHGADTWSPAGRAPDLQVVPGPPARLTVTAPATATSGMPLDPAPVVQAHDAFGNPCTGTAELALHGGGLTGTLTRPLVDGRAVFPEVHALRAAVGQVLVGRAGGVEGVSGPFAVAAGPAARVVLHRVGSRAASGVPLRPAPVVDVVDASGNPVAAPAPVLLEVEQDPVRTGSVQLSGTTQVSVAAGRAELTDLVLTGAAGPVRLVATSASLQRGVLDLVLDAGGDGVATLQLGALAVQPLVEELPLPLLAPPPAPQLAATAELPALAPPEVAPGQVVVPEAVLPVLPLLAASQPQQVSDAAALPADNRRLPARTDDVVLLCSWAAAAAAVLVHARRGRRTAAASA